MLPPVLFLGKHAVHPSDGICHATLFKGEFRSIPLIRRSLPKPEGFGPHTAAQILVPLMADPPLQPVAPPFMAARKFRLFQKFHGQNVVSLYHAVSLFCRAFRIYPHQAGLKFP